MGWEDGAAFDFVAQGTSILIFSVRASAVFFGGRDGRAASGWRSSPFAAGVERSDSRSGTGLSVPRAGAIRVVPGRPARGRRGLDRLRVSYSEGEALGDGWRVTFWALGGRGVRTPR